jgi:hypothetical protein
LIINSNTQYYHSDSNIDFISKNVKAIYDYFNPFSPEESDIKRIKKFHIEPSFGPASWQFLYPPEFINACYSLIEALKFKNKELITDIKLNLLRISAGTLYSASYLFVLSAQIGFLFHKTLVPIIAPFVPAVGLIGSAICGFIETKKAVRQLYFISECKEHLKSLKAGQATPETLLFLKTFVPTDDPQETDRNFTKLVNRIRPWFFEEFIEEIEGTLPKLIDRLENPTTAESHAKWMARASRFVGHVKNQAEKKLILQMISVTAIAFLSFSFIATLLAQPYLIPALMIAGYFTVLIANYIHDSGTQRHLSRDFRPGDCIPDFIKKRIGMKTATQPASVFKKRYKPLPEPKKLSLQRLSSGTLSTSRKLSSRDLTVG